MIFTNWINGTRWEIVKRERMKFQWKEMVECRKDYLKENRLKDYLKENRLKDYQKENRLKNLKKLVQFLRQSKCTTNVCWPLLPPFLTSPAPPFLPPFFPSFRPSSLWSKWSQGQERGKGERWGGKREEEVEVKEGRNKERKPFLSSKF